MPMRPEVKAAWIGFAATIAAAFLTWYLTNLGNEHEKEALKAQRAQVISPEGVYLWQVVADASGDRWAGYINVDENGAPNVQMWRLEQCPNNKLVKLRLLQQDPGAKISIPQSGKFHIHIPIRFIKYDNKCQIPPEGQPAKLEPVQILEGDLDQTIGYQGNLRYVKQDGEEPFGGMLLIKSIQGSAPQ